MDEMDLTLSQASAWSRMTRASDGMGVGWHGRRMAWPGMVMDHFGRGGFVRNSKMKR